MFFPVDLQFTANYCKITRNAEYHFSYSGLLGLTDIKTCLNVDK